MTRTDTDTWNLATSVGATATLVAAGRAVATRNGDPLIDDRFAEPLVRAVGLDFFNRWIDGDIDTAAVDHDEAGWRLERMPDAMAVRTRYFDDFFADASAAGIRQVVILASGLDARAYRLAWPADTTVFEVDQPEVIEFKTATIAELGAQPSADLRAVPVDLRYDWPTALRGAGFDPSRPTAWLAEGLLAYLPPQAQDRLLDNVTALSAPGSRLAVEASPDMSAGPDTARETMRQAADKWRQHGLDMDFSNLGYLDERHDVAAYLEPKGWQSTGTTTGRLLADHGRAPAPASDTTISMNDVIYYTSTLLEPAGTTPADTAPETTTTTTTPRRGLNDAITRFWSFAAPIYDIDVLQQLVYRPAHDEVIAQLRNRAPRRVADIACGTGILADRIQRELAPDVVYGVDMSDGMLDKARTRSTAVQWRKAPAEQLPFDDNALDAVVTTSAFHFFDQAAAMREFSRVLAPGGVVAIATLSPRQPLPLHLLSANRLTPAHSPRPQQLRDLFAGAGLAVGEQHRVRRPVWTMLLSDMLTVGTKA